MRIKYIQGNKTGQIEEVSKNVAFGLIDSGKAIITKDITPDDITNKQEIQDDRTKLPKLRKRL